MPAYRCPEPFLESDSSSGSTNSGGDLGASLRRYKSLLADRLDHSLLALPPSTNGDDVDVDGPDQPPSGEILQALTLPSFLDGQLGDALLEYQVQKYLSDETYREHDSGESQAADVAVYSVDDDIPYEEFAKDAQLLRSRTTPVDEYDKLDPEEVEEHELKRALYRIKACLLLKGKAAANLDAAALETKFPRELILENYYFFKYKKHEAFGWYFDSKLCEVASLTDYQRLVIFNYGGDEYQDWSRYRSHYNAPETDREYLLYWKTITEKIKWVEDYMYLETFSHEWSNIERKAIYQAIRIATEFENIHFDLACLGIEEFLWSTRLDVYNLKDLDGVFFEIWKRVIRKEDCFAKALKEVYDLKMFPSRERCMKDEETMAEQFHQCTVGITAEVPEPKARKLIAHQVRQKLAMTRGYEHYARKKLKVAEYIGLIPKGST
ncbi:unnamed protein product [Alopecurus aequalis]